MNYIELLNRIKAVAGTLAESVYDGDVYENWNSAEVKYSSINIALENVTADGFNTTYHFVLYFGDRLLQDKSNANFLITDGVQALQILINTLNNEEEINIDGEIEYYPIVQEFADYLAGVYCDVDITVSSSLGLCELGDFEGESGNTPTTDYERGYEDGYAQGYEDGQAGCTGEVKSAVLTESQFAALEVKDENTVYSVVSAYGKLESVWIGEECVWVPIID